MREYTPQVRKTRFERLLQAFAQTSLGGKLFIGCLPGHRPPPAAG